MEINDRINAINDFLDWLMQKHVIIRAIGGVRPYSSELVEEYCESIDIW